MVFPRCRYNCYKDIKYLRPLCRLSFFMGLSPAWNSDGKNHRIRSWYKFYGLFVICLIVAGAVVSIMGRIWYVYPMLSTTVVIMQSTSVFVLTVTNVWSIYNLSAKHTDEFNLFLKQLIQIDKKMSRISSVHPNKVGKFYREFILGHVFIFLFYVYDAYLWIHELGFTTFRFYVFRGFQNYFNFVLMLTIRNYVLVLKYRYQNLNQLIDGYVSGICKMKIATNKVAGWTVRDLSKIFSMLNEEVSLCNRIFGFPLLFLSLYFVSELLHSLLMCIVYYVQKTSDIRGVVFGDNLLILCVLWALKESILFLFIISPCDEATGEAKQTSIVCFRLLQDLPAGNGILQEASLREDLILLAIQSSTRYPTFSAAGFFTVDYTMLFTLLGSITSYLVVLIQFN